MLHLFATGGTIAESPAGSRMHLTGDALASSVGPLAEDVQVHDVMDYPSTYVGPAEVLQLAEAIRLRVNESFSGAVVTHGTATLEENAYLLELLLPLRAPVVMTGAMLKPLDAGYDGSRNLRDALLCAASKAAGGRGVLVVMNGEVHSSRWVAKTSATSVAAFESPEAGPIGAVEYGQVRFFGPPAPAETFAITDALPRVELVRCYVGMGPEIVDAVAATGSPGIVLEAMGGGGVPPAIVPALDRAIASGVVVAMTTRCAKGRLGRRAESDHLITGFGLDLQRRGILVSPMSGLKTRLRIMVAMAAGLDRASLARTIEALPPTVSLT